MGLVYRPAQCAWSGPLLLSGWLSSSSTAQIHLTSKVSYINWCVFLPSPQKANLVSITTLMPRIVYYFFGYLFRCKNKQRHYQVALRINFLSQPVQKILQGGEIIYQFDAIPSNFCYFIFALGLFLQMFFLRRMGRHCFLSGFLPLTLNFL